ncbi:MAG: error-prone DNA polymerase [Proteobacteria bacterium]|nr:error-prone DNA polymerase [Pseudomonadota bacterium]
MTLPAYAELHCLTNFSFLRGASHPEELAERAAQLGYAALAITDECSVAGVVKAHLAAKQSGLKLIIGSELRLDDGMKLVLLARNRAGYGNLTALITLGRRRAEKGAYCLLRGDFEGWNGGGMPDCLALWIAPREAAEEDGQWLAGHFPGRAWIAYERHLAADDAEHLAHLRMLSQATGLPLAASGDVHMHSRARRPLQDVVTALRLHTSVDHAGHALFPNGERSLRPRVRLARLYPSELLAETLRIAALCEFSLDELRYEYPDEVVPAGETPATFLRRCVEEGLLRRYSAGVPEPVRAQIEHELALIGELGYEQYFLTVYDIVAFACGRGILCQGRGSAANSAVCYALGITGVDPVHGKMLFERFVSKERHEPPDIDVDFEHQRREEVIQYIYRKYGRERAALVATVVGYRTRGALRDVGRALGFERARIDALTASLSWWDNREDLPARFQAAGLDPASPRVDKWLRLAAEIRRFPRHLSQHVGGFVISRGRLDRLVPIENARMAERSVIQWDKNDIDALGLMKVDVLALGMLTTIRRALDLVSRRHGRPFRLQDVPLEVPAVYEMISAADTIGVFQIESRAQMAMLPRLRPRRFYDLVIEVAIVRPGPIQGDMVHPYLRRRDGLEEITYQSEAVRGVLERTLGVPLFQEQAMQLAIVAAGFTPDEADQLRRSMAAWRLKGDVGSFRDKLVNGMRDRGYTQEFAERLFRQIEGFGEYGFPESHAMSFALLVYVSAWLKCFEPAAFLCALLNSLPMGFYSASQLVQDARRHGVEVRAVDVAASDWESTLVAGRQTAQANATAVPPAVRLGLQRIAGLSQATGERIAAARVKKESSAGAFRDVADLARRARLTRADLDLLAGAGALARLAGHRRQAAWAVSDVPVQGDLLAEAPPRDDKVIPQGRVPAFASGVFPSVITLAAPSEGQNLVADYASLRLTLGRHPLCLLREKLTALRYAAAAQLHALASGCPARCAGIVTGRQRPLTAAGTLFVTLEDETGYANIVVHPGLVERQRRELLGARLLGVLGVLQREGEVVHLVARRLVDHSELLGPLATRSRDFR